MIIAARNLHRHIYAIASSLKNGSWNDSLQSHWSHSPPGRFFDFLSKFIHSGPPLLCQYDMPFHMVSPFYSLEAS